MKHRTPTPAQIHEARDNAKQRENETRNEAINRYMLDQESKTGTIAALRFDIRLCAGVAILATVAALVIAVAAILGKI